MMGSLSGSLASMGAAVPYAIGAKFAHPDRPVITFVGDGAMQMNNMAELITVSKYWRNWSNPTWICLVLNNADLNQVTWEERTEVGDVRFPETQSIPSVPYHKFAELIGLKGIYVDTAEGCGPACDAALAADRPCVIEVKTDPDVPPLSPAITLEQARNFMAVLLKGDPEEGGVILETAKQMLSSVLPHHKELGAWLTGLPGAQPGQSARARLHGADRQAGVGRHLRLGQDHHRRRRGGRR